MQPINTLYELNQEIVAFVIPGDTCVLYSHFACCIQN